MNKINFSIPDWVPKIGGKSFGIDIPEISLPTFEHGGIIPEPTLLYGLKSQRAYAIAGEKGVEYVSPSGPSVAIYINEMNVRDDRDIERVADALVRKIRLRTGAAM